MPTSPDTGKRVVWWSRGGRDYSRDRNVRQQLRELDWRIEDFRPRLSRFGHLEAWMRRMATPDLVWVPCFRQRDMAAAGEWCRRAGAPLVFDPLISAYDKQVHEKRQLAADSRDAKRLLTWERGLFAAADVVVADTTCHAEYFHDQFGVPRNRLVVIPVGADDELFSPQASRVFARPLRVLFYGSFIGLQGPEVIVEAARQTPSVHWTLLGDGPLNVRCRELAAGHANIEFVPWVPYETLPLWIGGADVLLGVFGESDKAGRVIPNKVFQPLACGRPVITRTSDAYPEAVAKSSPSETGVFWVEPGSPQRLSEAVLKIDSQPEKLPGLCIAARMTYERHFRAEVLRQALEQTLELADRNRPQRRRAA